MELMSLTVVSLHELQDALANREAARERMHKLVTDATPLYKESLGLKWWNFIRNRKTSEQLLYDDYNASWWRTKADVLCGAGLIPEALLEDLSNDHYAALSTIEQLALTGKESFHVGDSLIRFINKWKTKTA